MTCLTMIVPCGETMNGQKESFLPGDFSQTADEDGKNVANARQDLQTVVDANDTVIARIGLQVVLLHDVHSRCRNSTRVAAAAL